MRRSQTKWRPSWSLKWVKNLEQSLISSRNSAISSLKHPGKCVTCEVSYVGSLRGQTPPIFDWFASFHGTRRCWTRWPLKWRYNFHSRIFRPNNLIFPECSCLIIRLEVSVDSDRDSVLESEDGKEVAVRQLFFFFRSTVFIFRLQSMDIFSLLFNSIQMKTWTKRKK